MRIIFLNCWFGKIGKLYFNFIKKEAPKTDIFCFMEVTPDLHGQLSKILKEFESVYDKGTLLKEIGTMCGQAVFASKKIKLITSGKIQIYPQLKNDMGFMQYLKLQSSNGEFWLGNVHGKAIPGTKIDTPVRIKQSEKIINFFKNKNGLKIVGGDFNLNPDTQSIKMFEKAGYRNLVREFKIKATRNKISWKQFQNEPGFVKQYFADYVFVSSDVKVISFKVPYMEISNHLPQILECEL
jgi:hypothetical protein